MDITRFEDIPKEMIERLDQAKELVLAENGTIRIISHYDADGICAAGVLCNALSREGRKFHVTLTHSLSEDFVDELSQEEYPITILCDMGSGQLDSLSKLKGKVIVLDHHTPQNDSE